MNKKMYSVLSILITIAMILAACTPMPAQKPETPGSTATAPSEIVGKKVKICQLTDVGGIDDKSFNATAWKGVQKAIDELGVEGKYLESQQQTDYEKNIKAFVDEDCDLIITVGFLLTDATKVASEKYPDQKFAIIDVIYDPELENVLSLWYAIEEATFMAGYLAAGVTKTGKVGVFGGIQFRALEYFLDGYWLGVQYYNEKHGTNVEVLGWDPKTRTGLFAGNFESTDDGRRLGETLLDEGADIIMPVAGPVGLGTAAAIKDRGNAYLIGVDTDWTVSAPEYAEITLTSCEKRMDQSVFDAAKQVIDGTFKGGTYVGTLANGGVGLSPFHQLDGMVSPELKAELEQIKADIMAGKIKTVP